MSEIKPATDEEIAGYGGEIAIYQRDPVDRYLHCVQCDASPGDMGGHRPGCDFTVWPRIKARIEAERALREELVAALATERELRESLESSLRNLHHFALSPIQQNYNLPMSGLTIEIRDALRRALAKEIVLTQKLDERESKCLPECRLASPEETIFTLQSWVHAQDCPRAKAGRP